MSISPSTNFETRTEIANKVGLWLHRPLVASREKEIMKFLILMIFTLTLSSCSENYEFGDKDLIIDLKEIQWPDLKECPDQYNEDTILISGRFHYSFEDVSINQDSDGIWLNSFNSLLVDQEFQQKMDNRNIKLFGLFNSSDKGHLGRYLGTIEKVFYLKIEQSQLPTNCICEPGNNELIHLLRQVKMIASENKITNKTGSLAALAVWLNIKL